jgi:hypothetical protein
MIFQKGDTPVLIVHTTTHILHITMYILKENYDTSLQECYHCYFLCHIYNPSSYDHISLIQNKCSLAGELPIYLRGKRLSHNIILTTTTCIIPITVYVIQSKDINSR